MNIVLLAGLRTSLARLVATGLAVALSVGFVVATLTLSTTFTRTTEQTLTANMSHADVRITPTVAMVATSDPRTSTDVLTDVLPRVLALDQVAGADVERLALVELRSGSTRSAAQVATVLDESVRWQQLSAGVWPATVAEATLDQTAVSALGLTLGDILSIAPASTGVGAINVTIVGITSPDSAGVGTGAPTLLMLPAVLDNPVYFPVSTGVLVAGDNIAAADLVGAVSAAVAGSPGIVVQTAAQAVDYQTGELSGSGTILTSILLAFAAVALFVASMVISNTFQVLVAQRTREFALLRCIGASTAQVRGLILGEAFVLGAVASAAGVALGIVGAGALAALSRTDSSTLHLGELVTDPLQLALGMAIGMSLTLLSALSPAHRATRVRPVAALRAVEAPRTATSFVLRAIVAAALIAVGGYTLVGGATRSGLGLAVAAGVISFVGVLLASTLLIPWIVRVAGLLIAWTSVPARLASLNASRNPGRTASTAAALLVGVTLVTMMVVGVTSVRTSVNDKIDEKRPVDLTVQTDDPAGFTATMVGQIAALPGVEESAVITAGRLGLSADGVAEFQLPARGVVPEEARAVARSAPTVAAAGEIVLNPSNARGLTDGTGVTVRGSGGERMLTARFDPAAQPGQVVVTAEDLLVVVASPTTTQVQLRLSDTASGAEVQLISSGIMSLGEDLVVGGGAPERTYYAQILDVMLLIVLALLTIAVVIAVVGVANTLALSVLERRRESGLLRALGLTRGQLRGMLAVEAALIALVAAGCGVVLGIVYAWAGLSAVALQANKLSLSVHLPWDQLGIILGGTLVAGVLASVIPARQATRKSPVNALSGR
ncbi:putative ABC transport system permease protein [Glaciihabitans tibetensis]|uniref:Putative ABC transport system permease protein n=1 Tax=Glaciihabitans tibetensis TaxID=1266600 RepID=A0A2T0VGP7_9MICO|nr:FtsX-like permease family protein [Glaciihabitans tibetensis]PRY69398.1 putative ABC transport system permease protein [Glaciihabitans tibetensis]